MTEQRDHLEPPRPTPGEAVPWQGNHHDADTLANLEAEVHTALRELPLAEMSRDELLRTMQQLQSLTVRLRALQAEMLAELDRATSSAFPHTGRPRQPEIVAWYSEFPQEAPP